MSPPPTNDSERATKATAAQERAQRNHERRAKIAARLGKLTYTVEEVAVALECDEATVWRMIKSGTIASLKIGGLRKIPAAEFKRITGQDATGAGG